VVFGMFHGVTSGDRNSGFMHAPSKRPAVAAEPGDHNSAERSRPSPRSCLSDNLQLYPFYRLEHDRGHPKRQVSRSAENPAGRKRKGLIMHKPGASQQRSVAAGQPGLLAPDTTGMNFYRADPALADLLRIHLPEALFRHIEPHLDRLGELAGGYLDECARLADRHGPGLHARDKFGRDTQSIEYHPAYRAPEDAAFGQFGIHPMSTRKRILSWAAKTPP